MNVVLIGMRGSGKSTVGRFLADMLMRSLTDTDEIIMSRAGGSITEMVARSGWDRFREIEAAVAAEAAAAYDQVIVTGGGTVTRPENMARLKQNGVVVWLQAGIDELLRRTAGNQDRPPLVKGRILRQDMEITFNERLSLYAGAADIKVDTEGRSPAAIAGTITSQLLLGGWPVIPGQAEVCAVIGDPVAHSLSPALHNAAYRALGLDFIYIPFPAPHIKPALERARANGWRGLSITLPHKTTAVSYLDHKDSAVSAIGAVNTVVIANGRLTGHNTDCAAVVGALEAEIDLAGKQAVVIGAGGMAAAAAFGLKEKGVALVLLDRTAERAARLAQRFHLPAWGGLEGLPASLAGADILINATPAGMWPRVDETIVPIELLHERLTVLDAIYTPRETRLLREAAARGARVIHGDDVFLRQAATQFQLFTGRAAPLEVMKQVLLDSGG